jgi:hypothetical protein
MDFKTIFFRNADVADNAGGAAATIEADVNTQNTDANQLDTSAVQKIELPDEVVAQLKEYEELKLKWNAANNKEPEKSAEQIAKENEEDKANFINYAVKNELFKIDDLTQYETLSVKKDADLVFESFLKDFKEENTDITDEKELAEAAKEEFDRTYKLSSENEKAKEKGIAKLAKEANEIRTPYKSKVESAKTAYTEEKAIAAKMPAFDKFVDTEIAKYATDKVFFKIKAGEEEVPVEIELSKEDKEAIAKEFKTHKTFYKYNTAGEEEAAKALGKKITGWIKVNKFDEALAKVASTFEGIGRAKGSNVGAENLFGIAGDKAKAAAVTDTSSAQSANKAAQQYRNRK